MYGDELPEELVTLLERALERDRLRTVLQLISAAAKHNLERDTEVRMRHRYRSAPPEEVGGVFRDGLATAKLTGKLGNATSSKKMSDSEVVDLVRGIVRGDGLSRERVDDVCAAILGDQRP